MTANSKTIARINEVEIVIIENGDKRVAVKPICEILGISVQGQLEKLKTDPILSSVVKLSLTTGADGKEYEMVTIPFKFVFGWLFRIDSRNVKEEARENVLKYQIQCYDVLFNHFTAHSEFIEQKQTVIDKALTEYEMAKGDFRTANNKMKAAEKDLKQARELSFDDFDSERRQLKLNI